MTPILVLAVVMAFLSGLLVVPLWRRFVRLASSTEDSLDPAEILVATRPARDNYQPIGRLFAKEDFQLLARHPALAGRLRRDRRQVLRLYLRQLETDFRRVHGICRALAASSRNPVFSALIGRQALQFGRQLLLVRIYCALGLVGQVQTKAATLANALDHLRETARASLALAAPESKQPVELLTHFTSS